MIFTTACTSEMVRPMSDPELVDLLVDSRVRNATRGITGLLLYRSGRVMQMLEGEARAVRSLDDRIRMDVRHQRVTNVWTSSASDRRFPSWTMAFEDLERDGPGRRSTTAARRTARARARSLRPSSAPRTAPPSSRTTSTGAERRCAGPSSAVTGSSGRSASS